MLEKKQWSRSPLRGRRRSQSSIRSPATLRRDRQPTHHTPSPRKDDTPSLTLIRRRKYCDSPSVSPRSQGPQLEQNMPASIKAREITPPQGATLSTSQENQGRGKEPSSPSLTPSTRIHAVVGRKRRGRIPWPVLQRYSDSTTSKGNGEIPHSGPLQRHPDEHILSVEAMLDYRTLRGAIKCLLFVTNLKKGAMTWYKSLPPNSIHSWLKMKA